MSPKGARHWRLHLALEYVFSIRKTINRKLSILVGHYCFLRLLRRDYLGLLRVVYVSIGWNHVSLVSLWESIARELRWRKAYLSLLSLDLGRPWPFERYMMDASLWGAGVMRARCDPEVARHTGRFIKGWLFKHGELLS